MSTEPDAINWLKAHRKIYADAWSSQNAANLKAQDAYSWMADIIAGHERVFDVGCGDGQGVAELAKLGHSVVTVEENPDCIAKAVALCKSVDIPVTVRERGNIVVINEIVQVSYQPIENLEQPQVGEVLIVEGDVMNDEPLGDWLAGASKFDAVTCWCIGSHQARVTSAEAAHLYRLKMENAAYALAGLILAPGGVLQFVTRGISRGQQYEEEDARDEVRANREMAEVTSLIVDASSLSYLPFQPTSKADAIGLTQPGTGSERYRLTSLLARQPSALQ